MVSWSLPTCGQNKRSFHSTTSTCSVVRSSIRPCIQQMNGKYSEPATDSQSTESGMSRWINPSSASSATTQLTFQINNFRFDDIVGVGDLLLVNTILAGQCHDPTLFLAGHHNELLIVRRRRTPVLAARQRRTGSRHSRRSSCIEWMNEGGKVSTVIDWLMGWSVELVTEWWLTITLLVVFPDFIRIGYERAGAVEESYAHYRALQSERGTTWRIDRVGG